MHFRKITLFSEFGLNRYLEKSGEANEDFAVWALDVSWFNAMNQVIARDLAQQASFPFQKRGISTTNAPRFGNKYLRAQSGCFTVWTMNRVSPSEPVQRTSLEDLLEEILVHFNVEAKTPRIRAHDPFLRKLTCPKSEAEKVLGLLKKLGYSDSTIYPDHFGAAESVRRALY